MGTTAAERSFQAQTKLALVPEGLDHLWPGEPFENFGEKGCSTIVPHYVVDEHLVTKYRLAFERYGAYLELIGGDVPVEEPFSWEFTPVESAYPLKQAAMSMLLPDNLHYYQHGFYNVEDPGSEHCLPLKGDVPF